MSIQNEPLITKIHGFPRRRRTFVALRRQKGQLRARCVQPLLFEVQRNVSNIHFVFRAKSLAMEKSDKRPSKRSKSVAVSLTVEDIMSDDLTKVANAYWAPTNQAVLPFSPEIIEKIYQEDLTATDGKPVELVRLVLLEISRYLEK